MNSTLYKPNHIRTFTGQFVNLLDPDPNTINIIDIAHSLANQCRFAGHTISFYSIAEHSLLCSTLLDDQHKLAGLLHDASEAYLMDIPTPLKNILPGYKEMEDKFMKIIAAKFNFQYPLSQEVFSIDKFCLEYEWANYVISAKDFTSRVHKSPDLAESSFLKEFHRLQTLSIELNHLQNLQSIQSRMNIEVPKVNDNTPIPIIEITNP